MKNNLVVASLLITSVVAGPAWGAESVTEPKGYANGLVVSVDPLASEAGRKVLEMGGNAVDAAVATGMALAVTHPAAGNLGGGGFMVVRLASGESFTIEYREKAPKLATPTMFLDDQGKINRDTVDLGWLVVGVPGSPMGMWTAHQKAGRLPWKQLVEPAIKLANDGFVVSPALSKGLDETREDFLRMGEPARVYLDKDGKAPAPGSRLVLPDLAQTLRRIRDEGPAGFYQGPIAQKIDEAMRAHGGLIRAADLAEYRAMVRPTIQAGYRGYNVITAGPPSAGGVSLVQMLNILEGFDLRAKGPGTPASLHLFAEVMKRAFHDRAKYLGDPDFVEVPLEMLLSKEHAARWRKGITDRATPSASFGADILTGDESEETTHFSVIDREGNMVANTTTLEGSYGAKVIVPGTGFLLNNEMHDFNVKPGVTNARGLVGTPPNLIAPGKRMISSQTPALVLWDGKPFLIVGSPGGKTIPNTVLQTVVNVIDFEMPVQDAVDRGRIHHQWMPDSIRVEGRLGDAVPGQLEALGHRTTRRATWGDCHSIWIDPATGRYFPGVDRRIHGGVAGY